MKQLTQEEAERCEKAYEKPIHWTRLQGDRFDPRFWRPRLEDRLCELVEEQFKRMAKVQIQFKEGLCAVRIWDVQHGQCPYCSVGYKPICEALCEAIEKLNEAPTELPAEASQG